MRDYTRRFLIALIVALWVSLLFLGGKQSQAQMFSIQEQTAHWIWPANGVITDVFGTRNGEHKGIDIAAQAGSPIYVVDEGMVSKSYYSSSYGHVVFVKHKNNFETVYAHLKTRNVIEGKAVKQGEVIGTMGNTGDSSGVHLHFEIHEREWTFAKQNARNPILALGDVDIGGVITASPNPRSIAVTASLPSGQPNKYVVKSGDTLLAISRKTNTSVSDLKRRNHLTSDVIVPSQILIVQ